MISKTWAKTDVGRQRETNQDCHYVDPDGELIMVLDGMGGHKAGEVAADLAMRTISTFYKAHSHEVEEPLELFENYDHDYTYHANLLRQAVYNANRVVVQTSLEREELMGMGCTVAAMAVHDEVVSMINVGDSRLYLFRNGSMEQISRDHTLAEDQVERGIISREEAQESQLKHVLSSVIGVDNKIRVHMDELTAAVGDVFLLCSDGLTCVMKDYEIFDEISKQPPGPEILTTLVDVANARGGPDNVTVSLTVFSEGQGPSKETESSSPVSQ